MIARPEHAAVLAAIHAAAFPDDPWQAADFLALMGQSGTVGFIDEEGGCLLLRQVADEAEILTIGVMKRRQGIATGLMEAGIEYLKARQVSVLYLEVAASNIAARALYGKLGFTQAGLRRKYYAGGDDALLLSLRVGP